ncbi:SDR family NAD(P)-dependent oxidoreductase [Siccirubricoccus sp. KC 17139]|uniref:SDR family NAD(P)-dependent oxidoreductase n=1 Tax=Siccirubricoccus soli TaxID=2899147 RepID=A0ABT1D0Q1_9PROT|nr:SDR family NAD(P)-dependent oxidoreductase [Siccirubricoccus soli]MCO6415496.1 SDR family NAD(P)-dependent oxidoreductase [Siccirubricoccus soli]MCP2681628.1 SDR family NAD(P)-dependent oxidoreductase [Siccirubricoccus soli]
MADETWLILGASSALARAFAQEAAAHGADLLLAGRDMPDLEALAADLQLRHGVAATPLSWDAADLAAQPGFAAACAERVPGVLNLFLAAGAMPEQAAAEAEPSLAGAMWAVNVTGPAALLGAFAPILAARKAGRVVALGSVAGDRGRRRNHLYGASKAALATFLQGYAARLAASGVEVLCVKAGPADTAMTWALPKLPFMAQPAAMARAIWRRAGKGGGEAYVPLIWWPVMTLIRLLPRRIFNRLDF